MIPLNLSTMAVPTIQWTLTKYNEGYVIPANPSIYVCRRVYSAFSGKITLEIALKLDRTGYTLGLYRNNPITDVKTLIGDEDITFPERERTITWDHAIEWAEGSLHIETEIPEPIPAPPPSYEESESDPE